MGKIRIISASNSCGDCIFDQLGCITAANSLGLKDCRYLGSSQCYTADPDIARMLPGLHKVLERYKKLRYGIRKLKEHLHREVRC